MINKIIVGVAVLAVSLVVVVKLTENSPSEPVEQSDVISLNGLHWHPNLSISIRGENIVIPANIGLIGGHSPMHTHENDGTIHLEFDRKVEKKDIMLGQFFKLWNKKFNANQLLEHKPSENEKITMFVNGVENTEYENYVFGEHDEVKIVLE